MNHSTRSRTVGATHENWRDIARTPPEYVPPPVRSPAQGNGRAPRRGVDSQATQLAQMLLGDAAVQFLCDPTGTACARFPWDHRHEVTPVGSIVFRQWAAGRFYVLAGAVPSESAQRAALSVVEAEARQRGEVRPVFVRVGRIGHEIETIYIDLADDAGRVVEVAASGWRTLVNPDAPLFLRPPGMHALPNPVPGGLLGEFLRPFVNVAAPEDLHMISFWLLAALCPQGPYPVLVLTGEQGSGKSNTARLLRSLVDPRSPELLAAPRDVRDLMVAARHSWVLAFDNLSRIESWLLDAFCRLSTGGGLATRRLFTDADEVRFDAIRPMILTSIADIVTRGDLLDRALIMRLPPIPENRRRAESEFWRDIEEHRPRILGALLDALVLAIGRLPHVQTPTLPRMADFARFSLAAAPAVGLSEQEALAILGSAREEAVAVTLEHSPLAATVEALVNEREPWEGTATDLLTKLRGRTPDEARGRDFPATPRAISEQLRRIAPALRACGIDVTTGTRVGHQRDRLITIRRLTSSDTSHQRGS